MNLKALFAEHLSKNLPYIDSFHPFFNEALARMLIVGGKHFRAQLLLTVVSCKNKQMLDAALDAALALEFIHTYSLIHDDLPAMDNADLRRGEQTLHKRYDETTAILVGDALNTEAFLVLSKLKVKDSIKVALIQTLAYNAGLNGMVLGQAIDCYFENKKLNLEELKFLHTHKTGRLIAASLKMACLLCELEEKKCSLLYEFGLKIGLVFQINDDIIDYTMDETQLGKPSKNDVNKNSFVNLLGLEGAKTAKEKLLNECKEDLKSIDKDIAPSLLELIQIYL